MKITIKNCRQCPFLRARTLPGWAPETFCMGFVQLGGTELGDEGYPQQISEDKLDTIQRWCPLRDAWEAEEEDIVIEIEDCVSCLFSESRQVPSPAYVAELEMQKKTGIRDDRKLYEILCRGPICYQHFCWLGDRKIKDSEKDTIPDWCPLHNFDEVSE